MCLVMMKVNRVWVRTADLGIFLGRRFFVWILVCGVSSRITTLRKFSCGASWGWRDTTEIQLRTVVSRRDTTEIDLWTVVRRSNATEIRMRTVVRWHDATHSHLRYVE